MLKYNIVTCFSNITSAVLYYYKYSKGGQINDTRVTRSLIIQISECLSTHTNSVTK